MNLAAYGQSAYPQPPAYSTPSLGQSFQTQPSLQSSPFGAAAYSNEPSALRAPQPTAQFPQYQPPFRAPASGTPSEGARQQPSMSITSQKHLARLYGSTTQAGADPQMSIDPALIPPPAGEPAGEPLHPQPSASTTQPVEQVSGPGTEDETVQTDPQEVSPISTIQQAAENSACLRPLLQSHPEIFLEPCRVNLFSLKDAPRIRLDWDATHGEFKLSVKRQKGINPNIDLTLAMTPKLASVSGEEKQNLLTILDIQCRRNQLVFHSPLFLMDSICQAFSQYQLSPQDIWALRSKTQGYHSDFQYKFL